MTATPDKPRASEQHTDKAAPKPSAAPQTNPAWAAKPHQAETADSRARRARLLKALMLNLLLSPGAGQLYLGRIKSGVALLTVALLTIGSVATEIFRLAREIAAEILAGSATLEPASLLRLVHERSLDLGEFSNAVYLLLLLWLLAVADIVRLMFSRANGR